MKHFDLIGRTNVQPLATILPQCDDWFRAIRWRQEASGSPHKDTETIYLRMPSVISADTIFDSFDCQDYRLMEEPMIYDLVYRVAHLAYADPARAMLIKLAPGGHITPHVDQGSYANATDRYHLCITTNPRCWMRSGEDIVYPVPEELWWFDKHAEHEVHNEGDTSRVHLVVDCWKS